MTASNSAPVAMPTLAIAVNAPVDLTRVTCSPHFAC